MTNFDSPKITELRVAIENNDWYSSNRREYKIDLAEFNDFKNLLNTMKKHTKLMKKEMLGDTHIDVLAVSPFTTNGNVMLLDLKRYIIHEGCNVKEMVYIDNLGIYDTNQDIRFDSLLKATNYIFSEIEKELKRFKQSLEQ
jgi:hypothetical protein